MARTAVETLSAHIPDSATRQYKWLYWLKCAYESADQTNRETILKHEARGGKKIACHKGCAACCFNPSVPILKPEIQGISWYVCERMDESRQKQLMKNIIGMPGTTICPFLIDDQCAIYPLRPLACRQFLVQGECCNKLEDIIESRPEDIVMPDIKKNKKTAELMFRADGNFTRMKAKMLAQQRQLFDYTMQMHEVDWRGLCVLILKRRKW